MITETSDTNDLLVRALWHLELIYKYHRYRMPLADQESLAETIKAIREIM